MTPVFFTDYPIEALGDEPYKIAPVRELRIVSWDGDKYCSVKVDGVLTLIKRCYIYEEKGRLGEVKQICDDLLNLVEKWNTRIGERRNKKGLKK